jgi:hypothetical protein
MQCIPQAQGGQIMFDKEFFKGIVEQVHALSDDERKRRLKALKKHLNAEMKRRKMKPEKPKK